MSGQRRAGGWLASAVQGVAGALAALRGAVDTVPLRSRQVPDGRSAGGLADGGRRGQAAERRGTTPTPGPAYPGDYTGIPAMAYLADDNGEPDPGEVVWAWVPYEEDHTRGKDRPVLVIGRDGPWLLALPLTSKDHDLDAAQETSEGRSWIDVGSGAWDSRGRPSEARIDRVVRVDPTAVRREGARLDPVLYRRVTAAVQAALPRAERPPRG